MHCGTATVPFVALEACPSEWTGGWKRDESTVRNAGKSAQHLMTSSRTDFGADWTTGQTGSGNQAISRGLRAWVGVLETWSN